MAVDVGSAVGYLDLDISGFLAGLKSAQNEADKQSKNIAEKIGGNISGFGKSISSAGSTLTKNVTVPVVGAGTAIVTMSSKFESAMSKVQAISGASGNDLTKLTDKAKELGATTAWSASEVADGMTEMAKAGWSTEQIIDGMSGVLDAASASGENLASVSTIIADAITGFGMEAKDATKLADLLTQAANSGTIDINDLGESFKYIAPVANTMGFSVEEVTTALSAMSMAGIKGSQAGTSLRTMLTRMVKPTDQVAAAMDELGIVLTNEDGSFKSLNTIVDEMRGSFDGLTDDQKAYYATVLSGQEGMSGLLSLLNLTKEEYNAISNSMEKSGGVAKETADIMLNNLSGQVTILKSALEGLAIQFGEIILPYLKQFVEWIQNLTQKLSELSPEQKEQIVKWAAIAASIGPVLLIVGKLVTGFGGLITTVGKIPGAVSSIKTSFGVLTTGLKNIGEGFATAKAGFGGLAAQAGGLGTKIGVAAAGITGPMIAIAAVVAIVIAAFVSLWKNNEEFRNKITAIWDQIKATFEKLTSGIVERLNKLGFDFENIGEVLKAIWKGFCDLLAPYFEGVFQYIADTFDTIVNVILGIVDFFVALFTGDWEGCWNAVKDIFESIWNGIKDWFSNILDTIKGVLDVVLGWFGTSWENVWNSIKTFFENIWTGIVTWFQTTLTNISTFFSNIWNGIVTFFTGVWEGIKNVVTVGVMFIVELIKAWFNLVTLPFRFIWENCKDTIISIWESIKTAVSNALNAISTFISNIWNSIKAFLQPILTGIATFISNVWNGIKTGVSNAVNAIKTFITNAFNSIKTFVTNVWNGIKTVATTIWEGIKNAISTPINAAKTLINNIINSIKSIISNGFTSAKNTVTGVFDSIKTKITNVMNGARDIVKGAIDKIKSFFNFSWSLPKLKMPHFSITGNFSLNPPSVPKLSVEWYKKAMGNGMILDSATIFGFNSKTGKFLAGGEAGSETVVGTKNLMSMIKKAVTEAIGPFIQVSRELAKASIDLGYVTYNGFTRFKEFKEKQDEKHRNVNNGGDTFNFYSPKAIDEIEAAKQMKKAKRDLAEGF